ncbi:MAG: 1-acyl-sn-glycerol-3-phosphate acyltransferase [Kiritimatiellae bacterium]|nr:1-acyl-sn-glycerol-3-phosphate acyltransferase [Kiritimatiellia bacterium]
MAEPAVYRVTGNIRTILRSAATLALFALFGMGALLISPIVLVLGRPDRGQPVVRAAWRLAAAAFVRLRLIRVACDGLRPPPGSVIVANHPSLIDVVLLVASIPRTLYVAKRGLRANPFLAAIVRSTSLPSDATLPEAAAPYIARGWNVLVFPEGTRSPAPDRLGPMKRGAAQLALRTNAPVACVRIDVSRRILGKGQRPWDLGDSTVAFDMRMRVIPARTAGGEPLRAQAVRLTDEIRECLSPPAAERTPRPICRCGDAETSGAWREGTSAEPGARRT